MPTFDEYPFTIVLRPLRNPDDLETFILLPCVEAIASRDPKDDKSQVRIIQFRNNRGNDDDSGRQTHVHRVVQKIGTPHDYIEEGSSFVDVERIDGLPMRDKKTDSWVYARRFANTDEDDTWPAKPELLETIRNIAGDRVLRNVVRVTADNTPDGTTWADIELTFLTAVFDPKSNKQFFIYRFLWPEFGDPIDDETDPYLPFFLSVDTETMQIVDDGVGVDTPVAYRDSPLQNIVNINWGDAILVVSLEVDETNAGLVDEFIFTTPVIPERVARAATATTPAVPPLPALSDDTGIFMYGTEAHPFVFAPSYIYGNLLFPNIEPGTFKYYVKNFSAWMLKDAVGTSTTGFSNGNATKTVTWFVNLGRMLLTQPLVNGHKHVKYTLEVPGLGTVPTVYHKWLLIADGVNDVGDPFHYEIPANDTGGLGGYYGYARDVLLPASILPGTTSYSIIDEGPMLEWIPFFQQPVINWKLTFSTWAGRKNFPLNDQCLPDRTLGVDGKPKWDITKAASLVIKTGSGGPVAGKIMTIDVDSVGLKLTVTSVDVP